LRVLLDTHAFLWFIAGDARLSAFARTTIETADTERFLSTASLWEIAIKASLGRMMLKLSIPQLVTEHVESNAIQLLDIKPAHLDALITLPFHHRDPFDRLLIAQAQAENLSLLSCDSSFANYAVTCLWS
jgi:PIN domain nuclease of toxin-antitoxin system